MSRLEVVNLEKDFPETDQGAVWAFGQRLAHLGGFEAGFSQRPITTSNVQEANCLAQHFGTRCLVSEGGVGYRDCSATICGRLAAARCVCDAKEWIGGRFGFCSDLSDLHPPALWNTLLTLSWRGTWPSEFPRYIVIGASPFVSRSASKVSLAVPW